MFEAYKIGVKISVINHASAGLALLSRDFIKTEADAARLERRIMSIKEKALKGGLMLGMGVAGLSLFKAPLEEAKQFQTEVARFKALGVGDVVAADAVKFAQGMNTYGTSARENLGLLRDAMSVFSNIDHAKFVTPVLAKMKFANAALFGDEGGGMRDKAFMDMLKVVELRGGLASETAFMRQANMIQQVQTATGGRVGANEYLNFIKTGGLAAKGIKDDKFYYQFEPLIQEMGGSRVGTGLMSAYQGLIQGRTTVKAAKEMMAYGLLDPSKVEYNKIGMIKQVKVGALRDSENFIKDPLQWMEKTLLPALAKKGVTKDQDVLNAMGAIFSNRTAAQLFSTMYLQRSNIHKNEALNRKADDIETANKRAQGTMAGKEIDLQKKWNDLLLELGKTVLPLAIKGVEWLTTTIKDLTSWAKKNEGTVKLLTLAFAGLSAGLAIRGTVLLLTAAFQGLGVSLMFSQAGGILGLTKLAGVLKTLAISMAFSNVGGAAGIASLAGSLGTVGGQLAVLAKAAGVFMAAYAGWKLGGWLNDNAINPAVQKLTGDKDASLGTWIYDKLHVTDPNSRDYGKWSWDRSDPEKVLKKLNPIASKPQQPVQVNTQLFMDGRKIAEIVTKHIAGATGKPQAGSSSFDGRMAPAPIGMGYPR